MRSMRAILLPLSLSFALFACARPVVDPTPVAKVPAGPDVGDVGATCKTTAPTPVLADLTPVGEQCGGSVCRPGLHCCNASCGICTPRGVECTQQACFRAATATVASAGRAADR